MWTSCTMVMILWLPLISDLMASFDSWMSIWWINMAVARRINFKLRWHYQQCQSCIDLYSLIRHPWWELPHEVFLILSKVKTDFLPVIITHYPLGSLFYRVLPVHCPLPAPSAPSHAIYATAYDYFLYNKTADDIFMQYWRQAVMAKLYLKN